MKRLVLLSRPGCERCEELEDALHQAFAGRFSLDWRDVDRDPDWQRRYGQQIPVLLAEDGQPLSVGALDPQAVAAYLSPPVASV